MDCSNTDSSKQRRRWGPFGPRGNLVVALIVGCVVAAGIAFHFRLHLLWKYTESSLDLHDVQAIPNRPMPKVAVPDGWVRCREGCIEFNLPAELAENRIVPETGVTLVGFQNGSRRVLSDAFMHTAGISELLKAASEACPTTQRFTTMPRLRLACYQTAAGDFRWSMNAEEVRWHNFLILTRQLIATGSEGHTETFFGKDLDGIVHFTGERAALDWQSTNGPHAGHMHFRDRDQRIDPAWVRAVCRSITVISDPDTQR